MAIKVAQARMPLFIDLILHTLRMAITLFAFGSSPCSPCPLW